MADNLLYRRMVTCILFGISIQLVIRYMGSYYQLNNYLPIRGYVYSKLSFGEVYRWHFGFTAMRERSHKT